MAAPSFEGRVLVPRLDWRRLSRWLGRRRCSVVLRDGDRVGGTALLLIDLTVTILSVPREVRLCPDLVAVLSESNASKSFPAETAMGEVAAM